MATWSRAGRLRAGLVLAVMAAGCQSAPPARSPTTTRTATSGPVEAAAPVLAAAGDIACPAGQQPTQASCQQAQTFAVLQRLRPTVVAALGDNQYATRGGDDAKVNLPQAYTAGYARSWGRLRAITRPTPGNAEFKNDDAAPYFAYFGALAGRAGRGWYSYELGSWHVVVLNSNCFKAGGCGEGSPQYAWLVADLAAHPARCTLAYWHHPRFSSHKAGDDAALEPLWEALYAAGAEVVLNGHHHHYERFTPQDPSGTPDQARGIREFVVGTGGRSLAGFGTLKPSSQVRDSATFGVLALTLHPDGYDWRFVPQAGKRFSDAGSDRCH